MPWNDAPGVKREQKRVDPPAAPAPVHYNWTDAPGTQVHHNGEDDAFAPPAYQLPFPQAFSEWKAIREVAIELDVVEPQLLATQKELDSAKSSLKKLKAKSSEAFEALHKKKGILSNLFHLGKKKHDENHNGADDPNSQEALQAAFEHSHAEESSVAVTVANLQLKFDKLKEQRDHLFSLARKNDSAWFQVSHSPTATASVTGERAITIGTAVEELSSADSALELAKTRVADLNRARVTVQHAHMYFSGVLSKSDDLLGIKHGGVNSIVEGFGDATVNIMKDAEYKIVAGQANKAQVVLNECFRVLDPHLEELSIPADRKQDYDTLKSSGLLQIQKIRDLLYGGGAIDESVKKSVNTMRERQESMFAPLTHFAVWVQDTVPVVEGQERSARAARDNARLKVGELWAESDAVGAAIATEPIA